MKMDLEKFYKETHAEVKEAFNKRNYTVQALRSHKVDWTGAAKRKSRKS